MKDNLIVSENEKDLKRLNCRVLNLNPWTNEKGLIYEDNETIYFVTSGYGVFRFTVNSTEKAFQIYSGEYIWVPKGLKHDFSNLGECILRIICFTCNAK